MSTITVGPTGQFQTIHQAVAAAASGDTIDVQAGTYSNDFNTIRQSVTLQAVNGEVVMTETEQPPDGKAMITEGASGINVAINGFDISGVTVPDGNGAAIRYEGGALSLTNDYFHGNQDGLLGAPDANGSIAITHSEFAFNGNNAGSDHNLYIGAIANFSITDSYVHDAIVGHEIKSRAANNTIENNRIFDNQGSASYSIDLPNGGNATISGNQIEQGAATQNPAIIAYGEEGFTPGYGTTVSIASNTIVNDDPGGHFANTTTPLGFTDNSVWGLTTAQLRSDASGTIFLPSRPSLDTSSLTFINPTTGSGSPPPPTHGHGGHHHVSGAMTAADFAPVLAPSQVQLATAGTTSVTDQSVFVPAPGTTAT
jgi:hypothetical protein